MGVQILGIDVTQRQTEEIRNIIDTLNLRNLSKDSLHALYTYPKEMRQSWIDNPSSVGAFTDDNVKTLGSISSPHSVKIHEKSLGAVITFTLQRIADDMQPGQDFTKQVFASGTQSGLMTGLDMYAKQTGYSQRDFLRIRNLDLDGPLAVMDIDFRDGTSVKGFKFEKPTKVHGVSTSRAYADEITPMQPPRQIVMLDESLAPIERNEAEYVPAYL